MWRNTLLALVNAVKTKQWTFTSIIELHWLQIIPTSTILSIASETDVPKPEAMEAKSQNGGHIRQGRNAVEATKFLV